MVNIKSIRASNQAFSLSPYSSNLTAVFVGATSGIGLGTLKAFTKATSSPKIYIIGRSKPAVSALLSELQASNPSASLEFIESEISLIKNVESVCEIIKGKEEKVDVLFMSPGYLSFDGRNESSEGLDIPHALRLYTRLAFTYFLLPLLLSAPLPRVISILAGGRESASIDTSDLDLRAPGAFTWIRAAETGTTQTTLAFEELAKSYPQITFIHKYPGFVNTGVLDRLLTSGSSSWLLFLPTQLARWCILPVVNIFSMNISEAGERNLFVLTSSRYPSAKLASTPVSENGEEYFGTPKPAGVQTAEASVVKDGKGNGVYRLGPDDESAEPAATLEAYRTEGVDKLVWEHVRGVIERAVERS